MIGKVLKGFYDRNGIKHDLPQYDDTEVRELINGKAPLVHEHTNIQSDYATEDDEKHAGVYTDGENVKIELTLDNGESNDSATINMSNITNLKRALKNPATPALNGDSPVTNGIVYEALEGKDDVKFEDSDGFARVYVTTAEEDGGEIFLIIRKGEGAYKSAEINDSNIAYLQRVLSGQMSVDLESKFELADERLKLSYSGGTFAIEDDSLDVFDSSLLNKTYPLIVSMYDSNEDALVDYFGHCHMVQVESSQVATVWVGGRVIKMTKTGDTVTFDTYTIESIFA